jgi:chromate transporter
LGIAIATGGATLFGVNFLITLVLAGLAYKLVKRQSSPIHTPLALIPLHLWHETAVTWSKHLAHSLMGWAHTLSPSWNQVAFTTPPMLALLWYGLRTGLLTFGGAYTAIPFLQHDAVEVGQWMSNAQFLDGLALSGILPAPLIIFSTFVGYLGGGPGGAIAMTIGVFAPAFAFTLIGHDLVERLVENQTVHTFLDGVTAGVVGLIAAASIGLLQTAVTGPPTLVIFLLSLALLYRLKAKTAVALVMFMAGLLGWLFLQG